LSAILFQSVTTDVRLFATRSDYGTTSLAQRVEQRERTSRRADLFRGVKKLLELLKRRPVKGASVVVIRRTTGRTRTSGAQVAKYPRLVVHSSSIRPAESTVNRDIRAPIPKHDGIGAPTKACGARPDRRILGP